MKGRRAVAGNGQHTLPKFGQRPREHGGLPPSRASPRTRGSRSFVLTDFWSGSNRILKEDRSKLRVIALCATQHRPVVPNRARPGKNYGSIGSMPKIALKSVQEQLTYWQSERVAAIRAGDAERITRCERFIEQCRHVLVALNEAAKHVPKNDSK
jgi:hypothetical protein